MKHKIMVVDDEADILDISRMIIEREGWEAVLVQDAYNLLGKVREVKPDIVLLDIQLGGLDGRHLCKEIKNIEEHAGTPVILFSANDKLSTSIKESLCDDFLEKPFELQSFIEMIKKHLPGK